MESTRLAPEIIDLQITTQSISPNEKELNNLISWSLTQRQQCDLEILLNGGFAPLEGFMTCLDYESTLAHMRLTNGALWPIPITLDVPLTFAERLDIGLDIALRNSEGSLLATMKITDLWKPDKTKEALLTFGTDDSTHPGVHYLFNKTAEVYIGGVIRKVAMPEHHDFCHLRKTPTELKHIFHQLGWQRVVAFQTRNPMHRAHVELTLRAAKEQDANLLVNPVVGMTKPGDIDYFTRVRCYEKIMNYYPEGLAYLNLLPLAMRMAGPREALWHALIRKNYGCTHFIIGRDHAGPGKNSKGENFYDPYAAQQLVAEFENEIGIKTVPFQEMVYIKNKQSYVPINEADSSDEVLNISGTELRQHLQEGKSIPSWFTYPEVVLELQKTCLPKTEQGFTVFFTGLSGSGKSTLAQALMAKLMELDKRRVTLLDGDIVRKQLSSELGFSKEHRNLNILRIGYVASEITKHRGIAICAAIAPYGSSRQAIRELISEQGGFLEVYMSTPLEVCEQRDHKGLYQKARIGLLPGFTGIDDPYEVPEKPELILDSTSLSLKILIDRILAKLMALGYLKEI